MLMNIVYGLAVMALCLIFQSLLLVLTVRYYGRHRHQVSEARFAITEAIVIIVMFLLVIGNVVQVAIWATLFVLLGEFATFGESFYHSAVNFATLGYGDIVMSEKHKLLGPLEAINGVLMIGVSTAMLITVFQNAFKERQQRRDA